MHVCMYIAVGQDSYICNLVQVDSEFAAGHYGEARIASDSARKVNKVGFWIGTFLHLIWIIVIVVDVIIVTTVANGGFNDYQLTDNSNCCCINFILQWFDLSMLTYNFIILCLQIYYEHYNQRQLHNIIQMYTHVSTSQLLSRRAVVSRKAKKKQHACASSGLCDHYNEFFTRMAALKI